MTTPEILDFVYPMTPAIRKCFIERQKHDWRRERLRQMIERYRAGESVDFEALHVKVDLMKLINN